MREVDVAVTGRAEHRRGPCGRPAERVRRGIAAAEVGLGLDDPDRAIAEHEDLAEQRARHDAGRSRVERARQAPAQPRSAPPSLCSTRPSFRLSTRSTSASVSVPLAERNTSRKANDFLPPPTYAPPYTSSSRTDP